MDVRELGVEEIPHIHPPRDDRSEATRPPPSAPPAGGAIAQGGGPIDAIKGGAAGIVKSSLSPSPPLTVLMAFHNDAPFIGEAIDSVLRQTHRDFEFVIVNDASNDGSRDIVARYTDPRIRLLENPTNLRLARSLNRGLEEARGALVARLDANDVARLDRLEKQMRFMRDHPEIALLGGQYAAIDTRGRFLPRAALP